MKLLNYVAVTLVLIGWYGLCFGIIKMGLDVYLDSKNPIFIVFISIGILMSGLPLGIISNDEAKK